MNKKIGFILCSVALATGAMAADINWNGEGDGTKWSDTNNWDNVVLPTKTENTIINFTNLIVNLDNTLGKVANAKFATENGASVIVTNGSMQIRSGIELASASSTASVYLTSMSSVAPTKTGNIKIGTGANAVGYLSSLGSTTTDWNDITIGSALNSRGTLKALGNTFTINESNTVSIAKGKGSYGKLALGTLSAANALDFTVATGNDSEGILTATSGAIVGNKLTVANKENAVGTFDMGTGTISMNILDIGSGNNSSGTVSAASIELTGKKWAKIAQGSNSYAKIEVTGAFINNKNIRVGDGIDATGILEAGSVDGTQLDVAAGVDSVGSVGTVTIVNDIDLSAQLNVATGEDTVGIVAVGKTLNVGNNIKIATGTNSIGSVVALTFNATANLMHIGSTKVGINSTGSLTMNNGALTIGDVLIGDGSTLELKDGFLTVTNSMEMGAGSELTIGAGQLLWTDTDAISIMDLWVTDGLVSTNDGFGQTVTSFAVLSVDGKKYGTGDTRLFIDLVDGDTKMWAETIPEPSTIGMMMVIGGGLFYIRRRRMI